MLVHVSNCDCLAILTERLDHAALERLGNRFAEIRREGIPLFDWADRMRGKKP